MTILTAIVIDEFLTVIGDGFVLVGFGKEGQELAADAQVAACQLAELAAQAAMRLRCLAGAFKQVRLGRVIGRKICLARDDMVKRCRCGNLLGVIETLAGLAEIIGGLGLHRSIPSRRNSCMNPVRSRYASV